MQTKRLSAVIDNIVDGIITINERGTIESFNPAARQIFGYSNAQVIGIGREVSGRRNNYYNAVTLDLKIPGAALNVMDWIQKPIEEKMLLDAIHSSLSQSVGQGGRLLHVEDDLDIATIVEALLADEYQVTHAGTLNQARHLVNDEVFDLVLLDIGLPDGSGLDLLATLESQKHQTPVIIFSARDVAPAIAEKVQGLLVKSKTDNEKLMQLIKSTISKKHERLI